MLRREGLELDPRFTLLIGDNGAGKTTVLDALAVAAGVWLVKPPDSALAGSGRNILPSEIRLLSMEEGDRTQFLECKPVSVEATGDLVGHPPGGAGKSGKTARERPTPQQRPPLISSNDISRACRPATAYRAR